jgi:hypothetical protein
MRIMLALGLAAILISPAAAQNASNPPPQNPPPARPLESVTVTATKASEAAINNFITSRTAPTRVAGKLARWKKGVCPETRGLGPNYAKFVTRRIREVAAAVGAPVDSSASCKTNIEIVFTTTPQELLDSVRTEHPSYLGYYDNADQAKKLAMVAHPIQSWYTTATADLTGSPQVDSGQSRGFSFSALGDTTTAPGGLALAPSMQTYDLPSATARSVTGSRLGDGLSSELFHVLIVAEPAKLLDHEVGTIADYIAVLALSQPAAADTCEALPSVTNLLSPGCTTIAETITDGDLAYLRGLYKATATGTLQGQRGEIRYQMEKTLVTDKN